ncbi:hypothetical protein RUND412_000021 [Rhizina undulata]
MASSSTTAHSSLLKPLSQFSGRGSSKAVGTNFRVSGTTPSSNRPLADIENKEFLTDIIRGGRVESMALFKDDRSSTAEIYFWDAAEAQRYFEVFGKKQLVIGGKAINAELCEVGPGDKDWRVSAENEEATRVFALLDFRGTSLEEFGFFKARLERTLEFCEIAKWELETLQIMMHLYVDRTDLLFRFSSISAAKLVKDALQSLGYDVIYEKDPCEGGVEELNAGNGFEEFADI